MSLPILTKRFTKEEAEAAGMVPDQAVWDEVTQSPMPLGEKIRLDIEIRESDPAWMLANYERQRKALVEFVATKMREAEYDEDGYPLKGKLHDYYQLPEYEQKALTKTGAEKLAAFFRLRVLKSPITHSVETAEFVSARVAVELVDIRMRAAGGYEGAATSAELGFQTPQVRQKYGAIGSWEKTADGTLWVESKPCDYRAGLHDIAARARKRGFVGAVITGVSAHELFDVTLSTTPGGEAALPEEDDQRIKRSKAHPTNGAAMPLGPESRRRRSAAPGGLTHMPIGTKRGKPITSITDEELQKAAGWCKRHEGMEDLGKKFEAILEARGVAAVPAR